MANKRDSKRKHSSSTPFDDSGWRFAVASEYRSFFPTSSAYEEESYLGIDRTSYLGEWRDPDLTWESESGLQCKSVPYSSTTPRQQINNIEDLLCSAFSPDDILDYLQKFLGVTSTLIPNKQYSQVPHFTMLQDINCAIRNGLDFGTLYAIARVKWSVIMCHQCKGRPAIGNARWKTANCITKECEYRGKELNCNCPQDKTRQWKQALYEPQISEGTIMHATYVPPRRLWDLKGNRVIPFYGTVSKLCQWCFENAHSTLGTKEGPRVIHNDKTRDPSHQTFEQDYWAVSHSWTNDMQLVDTPVNSHQWPVPIPRGAELEVIRKELRVCGADYCWLDVTCLRQPHVESRDPMLEELRLKEWRVDVPTIGNIYRNATGVLRYFNGLGLSYDERVEIWNDSRHWSNRAWTLQEMRPEEEMVNAGFTAGKRFSLQRFLRTSQGTRTLREMLKPLLEIGLAIHSPAGCSIIDLAKHMCKRFATNPVDKIAGINYLIWPKGWDFHLPVYSPSTHIEDAWLRCVQSMRRDLKVELLFLFPNPRSNTTTHKTKVELTWVPAWCQMEEFTGDVWTDFQLRAISADVYPNSLHPLVVPTVLWGLDQPLGILVFDDCSCLTSSTEVDIGEVYNIMLGIRGLSDTVFTTFQFYASHLPAEIVSSKLVLLCLSLEVNLPWVICASTTRADARHASLDIPSHYHRFLALEKLAVLRTDERFLIAQKFPTTYALPQRAYDAIAVV